MALDISSRLLAMGRSRGLPGHCVQFIEAAFEEYEDSRPFDAIIGSSILHHLVRRAALKTVIHLLKLGGVISFAEPHMLNPQVMVQKNVPCIKSWIGLDEGLQRTLAWYRRPAGSLAEAIYCTQGASL